MDCPRCGTPAVTTPACPRCGVIVAKARSMESREERIQRWNAAAAAARTPATESVFAESAPEEDHGFSRWWYAVAAIAVVLALAVGRKASRDRTPVASPVVSAPLASAADAPPPPAAAVRYPPPPTAAEIKAEVKGLSDADRQQTEALVRHVNRGGTITASDVSGAEVLLAAHPDEKILRELLEAVLLGAAFNERRQRNFVSAAAYLRRAAALDPTNVRPCSRWSRP